MRRLIARSLTDLLRIRRVANPKRRTCESSAESKKRRERGGEKEVKTVKQGKREIAASLQQQQQQGGGTICIIRSSERRDGIPGRHDGIIVTISGTEQSALRV